MIYFDNAATTKPDADSLKLAEKFLIERFYNPSALYTEGYSLQREIKSAKINILSPICNAQDFELVFTSCGTEADNQAIFCGYRRGNIVTTQGEHSAVFAAANELKQRGVEVRFAKLDCNGKVDADHLLSLVDDKTSLVSVIHVNNETGAINDICEIARLVKEKNKYALFHSDGVQAYGKIEFKLSKNVDLYSISAHKIGGLKGTGALIKRKNLVLKPYVYGGGQESGFRSGTENVFGIKTFEFAAMKKYKNLSENYLQAEKISNTVWENLDKDLFTRISPNNGTPYVLTVGADGLRGETILHEANDCGLLIGTGSACSSNEKKRYSRVILACGVKDSLTDGVLRLSFSSENTLEEAEEAARILNRIVKNRKEIMA